MGVIKKEDSIQDNRLTAVEVRLTHIEKLLENHIEHLHRYAIAVIGVVGTLCAALLKLLFC